MNKRWHYIWRWLMGLLICIQTQTHALFWFGESDKSDLSIFVPAHSIDSTSIMLAQSAIATLWHTNNIWWWALDQRNIPSITDLISYNIITAIQSSSNKTQTLNQHIANLQQAINQLDQINISSQSKVDQAQITMNECTTTKKIADASVIQAINSNNITQIDSLIKDSITSAQCEAANRVVMNTWSLIITKNKATITRLTRKMDFIEQHQEAIIQYPEIISDPDIIKELSQISSQF